MPQSLSRTCDVSRVALVLPDAGHNQVDEDGQDGVADDQADGDIHGCILRVSGQSGCCCDGFEHPGAGRVIPP